MPMNPVVHFEMPYDDGARAAGFYEKAFGWQMKPLGGDMGSYVLATTTETGQAGPTTPGAINGGLFPRKADWPAQYPSVIIAVEDIAQAMANVRQAAGTVLGEPVEVPRVGAYVSLLQPIARNGRAPDA
jgi:predicted enzyme related to lactoylglutathione lyase